MLTTKMRWTTPEPGRCLLELAGETHEARVVPHFAGKLHPDRQAVLAAM